MANLIGLLDCNNFFVSCERLFRPDLLNKPVVVLSSNDGCVIARSQEVKDMDIPMGVPYFKIKDILEKNAVCVFSSHFTLYRDISRRVFETLEAQIGQIEQYSIDEAFFELNDSDELLKKINIIKDKIEREVGIPVSIGVGKSKTLAKYANDLAKKDSGVNLLSDHFWRKRAEDVKLSSLWGIGYGLSKRYVEAGFYTASDFMNAEETQIRQRFGVVGNRLWRELHGLPVKERVKDLPKSLMSTRSFAKNITKLAVIEEALIFHVENIAEELREKNLVTRYLKVFISPSRHGDFSLQNRSEELILPIPTNNSFELIRQVVMASKRLFVEGVPYKKAGVIAYSLMSTDMVAQPLFRDERDVKESELLKTVDRINNYLGKNSLIIGANKHQKEWKSKQERISPAYTTRWNEVPTVKA